MPHTVPPRSLIDMPLAQIMSRWPGTISVFVQHRMYCVGCPISPFHTLVEAAEEHGLALHLLVEEVSAACGPDGAIREGPA